MYIMYNCILYNLVVLNYEGDLLRAICNLSSPSLPVARHYLKPVRISHFGFIQCSGGPSRKLGPLLAHAVS